MDAVATYVIVAVSLPAIRKAVLVRLAQSTQRLPYQTFSVSLVQLSMANWIQLT